MEIRAPLRSLAAAALAGLVGLTLCPSASTQKARDGTAFAQPRDLVVGSLRQGTHVEVSFIAFWKDEKKAHKKPTFELPPAVKVIGAESNNHSHHGAMTYVKLAISTDQLGELNAKVVARLDGTTVTVPIQAVVLPRDPLSPRVLVAQSPFEGYSAEDSSTFAAWRRVVDTGKLECHYLIGTEEGPVLPIGLLRRVDTVVLGESCLFQLKAEDLATIKGFVCGGGRVVVAANAFFNGSVARANHVLTDFGLRMDDVEPRGAGNIEATGEDIAQHPLTKGVAAVVAFRPSPTSITDPKIASAIVRVSAFPDQAFVAVARTETGGEVIALGQSLWWNWIIKDEGNSRLLRNLLTRRR